MQWLMTLDGQKFIIEEYDSISDWEKELRGKSTKT